MSPINKISNANLNIDQEYGLIFARFGSAIYFGQCFERIVVEYLIFQCGEAKEFSSLSSIEDQYNKYFDKTLGQLKAVVRDRNFLPPDELTFVNGLVDLRNSLAHKFFRENIHLISTTEGRTAILESLRTAEQEFVMGMLLFDEKILSLVKSKTVVDYDVAKYKLNLEQHRALLLHLQTTV